MVHSIWCPCWTVVTAVWLTWIGKHARVQAVPFDDLIESLPGYGVPSTPHYSGYLDATAGCDTSVNGYCKLHYWMSLATGDWQTKPVVLWLNGGPGSSSLFGFLQENGPLLFNASGGFMDNPWGWNRIANFFALEAPVGVGFSYCERQTKGKPCVNSDKWTARASRAAMQDFFASKFPELKDNEFFITGESYAGVYVPTLAKQILDHAPEINLKGVFVGNPCTDNTAQYDDVDTLWYGHKYGLVDDAIFDTLWNKCRVRMPSSQMDADVSPRAREGYESRWHRLLKHSKPVIVNQYDRDYYYTDECRLALRKFAISSSLAISTEWKDAFIDYYSLYGSYSTQENDDMTKWLNRDDVRAALHVTEAPTRVWPRDPAIGWNYTQEYAACNDNAKPGTKSMIDFYKYIVTKLQRTWVYSGDADPCITYEGTRTAVKRIGLEELDGGSYRPWFYNHTGVDPKLFWERPPIFGINLLINGIGAQMGGEVTNYEAGLTYATVHGSGHMVPQYK